MGKASSGAAGEEAFDLFDRWLAHHEGRPHDQTEAEPPADLNTGLPVEPPVDIVADPLFDESFVAPHTEELALEPENVPVLALPTDPEPGPEPDPQPDPEPTPEDPARAIFDLFNSEPEPPAPSPAPSPAPTVAAVSAPRSPAPRTESRGAVAAEPLPNAAAPEDASPEPVAVATAEPDHEVIPGVVEFAPRTGTRRLVGLMLLVCVAGAAVAGYVAYQDRTTPAIGIAASFALLAMVVWGVRAGAATAHLTVRGGQLEIIRGGGRNVFDLSSHYTPIDVIGEPGDRNWRVLFHRRSMSPFVVDASMVDPVEFTRVLRHYRPARD